MHGSRTIAHEQGAAAQTRHSERRHTCANARHGSRACTIPTHALRPAQDRPLHMCEATRAARPAPLQHPRLSSRLSSAPSCSSSIISCIFFASNTPAAAVDVSHAATSRSATSARPQAHVPHPHPPFFGLYGTASLNVQDSQCHCHSMMNFPPPREASSHAPAKRTVWPQLARAPCSHK